MAIVELSSQLTQRQQTLIQSGFSTFSVMEIRLAESADDPTPSAVLYKIACTVKYDTWQERYDLARISETVQTGIVKNFEDYAARCLTANIYDKAIVQQIQSGKDVVVTLRVDQISTSKATEIKEWLIRQQSGIMQGLFGHMLGELQLTERIDVKVKIPPKPGFKGS